MQHAGCVGPRPGLQYRVSLDVAPQFCGHFGGGMTQQAIESAAYDVAIAAYSNGNPQAARDIAQEALHDDPGNRDLLALLLRSAEALGDDEVAQKASETLRRLPLDLPTFGLLLDRALETGQIGQARTLVSEVEAEGRIDRPSAARAKARIALAIGDLEAATAILVMAIEETPSHAGLRRLMTEVLLARGSAGHARDVLAHLGQPPTEYDLDGNKVPPGLRDTA